MNVGNPQCVIEAGERVEEVDLARVGRRVETHELFPNRTNVSFVRIDGSTVRARIFERGAGETLASGTGASGAAVAAHLRRRREPDPRPDGRRRASGRRLRRHSIVTLTGTAEPRLRR